MKRLIISALSALALATLVAPAIASESTTVGQNLSGKGVASRTIVEITPFDLVTGGFQGRFKNQGIPAGGIFVSQIKTRGIKAEDLVKAAIAANRLTEETLQDETYLSDVEDFLVTLERS